MTLILWEDRQDLISFLVENDDVCEIINSGSRRAVRETRHIVVQESVARMGAAFNFVYGDQRSYRKAFMSRSPPSAIQTRVWPVQKQVVPYVEHRIRRAWRWRWLGTPKSDDWPRFGSYATMVRDNRQQLLLDPCHDKISLQGGRPTASVPKRSVWPIKARRRYSGEGI